MSRGRKIPITELDMSPAPDFVTETFSGEITCVESGLSTEYHGTGAANVMELIRNMQPGDSITVNCDGTGPVTCKTCGHPADMHSFYGETRSECHGETWDGKECNCIHYANAG